MNKHLVVAVVAVCAILPLVLGGCGGGSTYAPPGVVGAASFVGRAVCATCHGAIDAEFSTQNHGLNFRVVHGDQIDGRGGACAPCHTTGFQEPSGFVLGGSTPHLEGIGCEECHGPGSKHAAAPAADNINRVPDAQTTCWDCHAGSYKVLRGSVGATTDLDLRNTAPSKIHATHYQTPFLLGKGGYNIDSMPGPHTFVDNTCVTCHLNPDPNSVNLEQAGGPPDHVSHNDDSLKPDLATCAHCHGSDLRAQSKFDAFKEEIYAELIVLGGVDHTDPSLPDAAANGGLLADYANDPAHPFLNGAELGKNDHPDTGYVRRYKAARWNYSAILAGCFVHNPPFTQKLIEDAKERLSP